MLSSLSTTRHRWTLQSFKPDGFDLDGFDEDGYDESTLFDCLHYFH